MFASPFDSPAPLISGLCGTLFRRESAETRAGFTVFCKLKGRLTRGANEVIYCA